MHLLKHEGGYVNHPQDPGGETNMGVTRNAWEEYIGHPAKESAMRNLTVEQIIPFYKRKYWNAVKADNLPSGVNYAVFDAAVNSGPGRAAKWLQEAVGAFPDGAIGPKTLEAVNAMSPADVINAMCDTRQKFLEDLQTFKIFGKGWTRRVSEVREVALNMI